MSEHKLKMWQLTWDMSQPVVYLMLVGGLVGFFGQLGNQNFIQRVQATSTEKESQKAVATQLLVALPLNACLFALGTCLFIYYHAHPAAVSPAMKADGIFPLFAAQKLPAGLAGLVIAAIMAATMSTLSSALNSVSNIGVEDYVRRVKRDLSDHAALLWGKGLTVFLGAFGTVAALLLAKTNLSSIWDMAILVGGIFLAPMGGVYTLGMMTRRASTAGVWGGVALAIATSLYCQRHFTLHPMFFPMISINTTVIAGYLISLIFPGKKKDLTGLTVYSLPERTD